MPLFKVTILLLMFIATNNLSSSITFFYISVTEFSKKTGDYASLSATDIKVMALTYQLEVEANGKEHLKTEPTIKKTIVIGPRPPRPDNGETLAGFYMPKAELKSEDEIDKVIEQLSEVLVQDESNKEEVHSEDQNTNEEKNGDSGKDEDEEGYDTEEGCEEEEEVEESTEEEEDDDDGGGWITPGNIQQVKHSMVGNTETVQLDVACLTTDFAMQVGYINELQFK